MPSTFVPDLDLLQAEQRGSVLHLRLNRPAKRNALSDALVLQLQTAFVNLPEGTRAVVLSGAGDHFSAGLDLASLGEHSVAEGVMHSRMWHAAFEQIEFGRVPVIAVLHGAVVGGGLELATAAHIRIAERSTFYGLPEGQRGLFVGGGGSARIPRLVGAARMAMSTCARQAFRSNSSRPTVRRRGRLSSVGNDSTGPPAASCTS